MTNTLKNFQSTFDPIQAASERAKTVLATMAKEHAENWVYEADFCAQAHIAYKYLPKLHEIFAAHIVTVRVAGKHTRRAWFASAKIAAQARGIK
jgi:hypothetical protein